MSPIRFTFGAKFYVQGLPDVCRLVAVLVSLYRVIMVKLLR